MTINQLIHLLATEGQRHGRDAVVMVSFTSDPPDIAHITRVSSGHAARLADIADGEVLVFLDAERAKTELL